MQGRQGCRLRRGHRDWLCGVASVLALGMVVAGCVGGSGGSGLAARGVPGPSIAFESIDGPPPQVFDKLVRKLNEEAEARNVPVVSREAQVPYRIRGYVALGIQRKQQRTLVSWVWDVYDGEQQRVVRFAGEEPAGPPGSDAWAAANDEVLGRIARAGMERLAAYLQVPASVAAPQSSAVTGDPREAAAGAGTAGTVAAARDDFRPEAFGIFRLARNEPPPAAEPEASGEGAGPDIPLPRRRPPVSTARRGQVASVAPSPRVHRD